MCVIADADRAVGLGGVMGGAETEVSARTTDVLIEAAEFDPLSIRTTSRKLSLHSDSSYRFERGLDPEGVAWASRRACELILELAGGELAEGVIDVGQKPRAARSDHAPLRPDPADPGHPRAGQRHPADSLGPGQSRTAGRRRSRSR